MLQLKLWSESDWLAGDTRDANVQPAARTNRTRSAYEMDWRFFERWCRGQGALALPASTDTLARYLMHLVERGRKASTIRRARTSIGMIHREHGLPRPDCDDAIRMLERGISRRDSTKEKGAPPLLLPDLERMMKALGPTLREQRDRAVILLGFAGAFRSCELVALQTSDLTRTSYGLRVRVSRSSEEQGAVAIYTEIRSSRDALLCPVRAVEHWLGRLPNARGPLFRTVYGSRVTGEPLAPRAVSRAVQRAAARAQLTTEYSSHSLRGGLAASARAQGRSARAIRALGRWKDSRSVERYIDAALASTVP